MSEPAIRIERGQPIIHRKPSQFSQFFGVAGAHLRGDMREVLLDIDGKIERKVVPVSEIALPSAGRQYGVIPYGTPAMISCWAEHEYQGEQIGIFGRIRGIYIAALRSPVQGDEIEDGTLYESESFPIQYEDIEIEQHVRAEFSLWEKLSWRPNLPARTKTAVLRRAGNKCECCGRTGLWPNTLAIHHCTYARWGFEEPGDLLLLCQACHTAKHAGGEAWWSDPEQRAADHAEICDMIEHAMDRERRHDELDALREVALEITKDAAEVRKIDPTHT